MMRFVFKGTIREDFQPLHGSPVGTMSHLVTSAWCLRTLVTETLLNELFRLRSILIKLELPKSC
jgi:hypothetical protein